VRKVKSGSPSQQSGKKCEDLALAYLTKLGLKLIEKNFHSRFGEIDLILQDSETLVFVEVRFRKNQTRGTGIDSINFNKQKKIIQTAKLYLLSKGLYEQAPCRFDVVGVFYQENQLRCHWIQNAFH
jgi:putative endonuclease